jgi:hypothetical protein
VEARIMSPDAMKSKSRAGVMQAGPTGYQEECMMGLLLAAMVYFAVVAVCIRIVS